MLVFVPGRKALIEVDIVATQEREGVTTQVCIKIPGPAVVTVWLPATVLRPIDPWCEFVPAVPAAAPEPATVEG